jgi:N-acetyl-1-D-myo-inositol-2-amino-2-deoxy-alpha-D-glucopyranoside deacetylase
MKAIGSDFMGVDNVDDLPFAKDDALVTACVDGTPFVEAKMAAMAAHPTQIALDGPFFALSNNLGNQVWGFEYYSLVKGEKAAPFDTDGRETDLFAGLR